MKTENVKMEQKQLASQSEMFKKKKKVRKDIEGNLNDFCI